MHAVSSYYRARYYDPASGRFISEDPIRFDADFYRYVYDNPLRFKDPFGLKVTIYYWPTSGSPGAPGFNFGHVSLSVDGPDGQVYISWMPAQVGPFGSVPDEQINTTIAGGLQRDADAEGSAPSQVVLTNLNEKAILDWWKKYKKNTRFNIFGRDCATTVQNALTAGGAHPVGGLFPTPFDIYKDAQDIRDLGPWGPIIRLIQDSQGLK